MKECGKCYVIMAADHVTVIIIVVFIVVIIVALIVCFTLLLDFHTKFVKI